MAGLHFDITADNQNFIRRVEEATRGIANASKQMQLEGKKIDSAFNGISFGDALKKQIYEGAQSINGLTAQIISQRKTVRDLTQDINTLNEAYKKAGKGTDKGKELFSDLTQAKNTLAKEKDALFDLQTQQAQARLSVRKLKDEYSLYQKGSQDVIDSNNNMALSFKKTLAAVGGTAMIQKFISDVIKVRGEFQQLDVAFTTLLQSKEKANTLMAQMVETAAKTPFNLTEIATGAKQLVAYGFASEGVNDTLIRLGNIAAGLGLPLERLTYLYGTTMTQGRLYARDLMQFTTSGIPMLQGLASMYGVTTDKVNEMISAGKIGFPEVQKVIENLTNEGGKFFNLMEEQSKTITGKISNLGDAWDTMLNKVGESQEGVINNSIDGLKYLIENYEQVGRILIGVIELYGTYRAALLANAIIEQGFTKAIWGKVAATKAAAIAQAAFNKVLKGNIYVAIASAALSFGIAMWTLADHTTTAEKAQKRFNDALTAQKQKLDDTKRSAEELISTIKSETATHYDKMAAYLKLQGIMPEVFKNMDIEKLKLMDILSYNKLIAEEINRRERVGAKTSLVLKTNAYSEAKERYSKTSSRNSNILTYYAQMKAAEEDMKLAQKQVDEIEKIQSEANKQKGKEGKKVVVENKEFWEAQKKDAQTKLDALTYIEAAGKKGADLKDQINNYDKKINSFSASKTSSQENKARKSAEELREQQEKLKELSLKQSLYQSRSAEDLQTQVDQARINAMDEGSKKTLAQMELNFEKEMQAIDRQKEDLLRKKIEDERAAFDKKEDENKAKDPKYKKQTFDPVGITLSDGENKQFDELYKAQIAEKEKEEKAYLDNLLEKHQDYTDKRLAIEKKFNADISALDEQRKKAVENGDTKQVEQIDLAKAQATTNKGKDLMSMDYDKLKESPEYVRAFENLKETSSETLNSLLTQLENAKGTAAKVLSPDQLREYTTTIQEVMDELDARNPFQSLSDKKKELAEAEQELADAQMALENARQTADAVKGGAQIENGVKSSKFNPKTGKIDSTKAYLTEAQALEKVKEKTDNYNKAKDKTTKASAKVQTAEKKVASVIGELGDSLKGLGSAIGGQAGEIIGLIGDIGTFAMTAMNGVGTASTTASAAIKAVEKASVILAIISAAIQIATKIASLFKDDDGIEQYEKAKEAYESYINILDRVIDKHLELAETLSGKNADAAYQKAIDTVKLQSENAKTLGRQYLNSGASKGFLGIGSSASKGRKEVEDMSLEGWKQAADALGMTIDQFKDKMGGRMEGLFNLTDEQLAALQSDAGIFWSQLDSDTQNYADQVANGVAKVAEVIEQRMTDTTLIDISSLRSDFQDLLTDMDSDSADFADNFEEYMKNAIINSLIKDEYMNDLKAWREKFYNAMESGVSKDEYNDLKDEGKRISDEMKAKQEAMKEMYGWTGEDDDEREASKKGFASMSQDSADELNGRFTVIQGHTYEINGSIKAIQSDTAKMAEKLSFLTNMDKNMSDMVRGHDVIVAHLSNIEGYTANLVDIRQFMYSMKLGVDTLNTKGITLKR